MIEAKNLLVTISPTPYANPLLLSMVPENAQFFLGVDVTVSNPSGVSLVGKGGAGAPFSYTVVSSFDTSGEIAPGVDLNADGTITGTPTAQGVYSFVAQVEDSGSNVFLHSFSISVQSGLFVLSGPPTIGEQDVTYRFEFLVYDAAGTRLTSGFTFASGTFPAGLTVNADGTLTGTPTNLAVGVSYFVVNATDGTASIDISCVMTVAAPVALAFVQDRDPPNGWGGGSGSWLPSILRGIEYEADLVITGGVPPYTLTESLVDPLPIGVNLVPNRLYIRGKTEDAASPFPILIAIQVTDAVGGIDLAQRAVFVIDSQQGRIQPRKNGVDVSGGNGALQWNFVDGTGTEADVSNDGNTVTVSFNSVGTTLIRARLATAAALPANVYNNGASGVGATLTGVSVGVLTVDGAAAALSDIIIVQSEVATSHNGAYRVTTLGTVGVPYVLTRDTRMDGSTEFSGILLTTGPDGTANKDITYECTAAEPVVVGTTAITFQAIGNAYTPPVTTKGDLFGYGSAPARVAAGANGTIPYYDSTQATGINKGAPGGDLTGTYPSPTLVASGVTAAPYGDATHVATFTVDAKGRITGASSVAITFPSSQSPVQWQDEGANLGTSGSGTTVNFTGLGVTASGTGSTKTITIPGGAPAAGIMYFGDGRDSAVVMDGTNTFAAFATKSGSVYTLTRDLYCDTLQINNSAQLKPNGFRIFCYTGILDCTGAASPAIFFNGNVGGNATGASLGGGGALTSQAGTLGWGANGGTGTNGGTGAGGAGSTGARPNGTSNGGTGGPPSLVGASGGTGSGGAGGNQAAATATIPFVWSRPDADMYVISSVGSGTPPWSTLTAGGGGSGGGAGGGNAVQSGGGGGGGGGGGAVGYLAARDIYCGAYALVSANGGAGGNGGLGNATNTGGGGGGSGGGGGLFHCVYSTLSGPGGCTLTAIGGVGGTGAAGQGTGTAGKGGTGGSGGLIIDFNIGTGVTTTTSGVAGSANSGTAGGAGGACTRTLTP